MKISDYFDLIQTTQCKKTGLDVDYQVLVLHDSRQIVLLFQGTSSKTDLLIDLNFPVSVYKHQYSCIKAHGGFVKAWKSANDTVMHDLISTWSTVSDYEVVITGHSLGGALATLASEDFYYRTGRKVNLLTFGCPNILFGKKSMRYLRSCCNSMFQYAQYNDIVPAIPLGYRQVNKIKCGRKFNLFECLFNMIKYHTGYGDENIYR